MNTKPQRFRRHCTCGASWWGTASGIGPVALLVAMEVEHSGPGHAPCDARTAAAVRHRQERQDAAELTNGRTRT